MEEILSQVLRPGTFAIAVAIVIATFFTKRIAELAYPKLRTSSKGVIVGSDKEVVRETTYPNKLSMWWNEVVLYAIPVLFGALFALSKSDFLYGGIDSFGGKVLFSAGVGWFSSFFYKIFRKLVLKKTGVDIQPGSIEPPAKE